MAYNSKYNSNGFSEIDDDDFKDRRFSLPVSFLRSDGQKSLSQYRREDHIGSNDSFTSSSSNEEFINPRECKQINSHKFTDFCIKNLQNHVYGRKEIKLAELEMPALLKIRKNFGKPLRHSKIIGCTHINAQTAVFIETLVSLGASVKWSSCNIYSTQDDVAAALVENNISVYGWGRETEEDFWWCISECFKDFKPTLLVDDGGDATSVLFKKYPIYAVTLKGIVEDSQTGIHRLYQLCKENKLKVPSMNLHDTITKSKINNFVFQRESAVDGIKRCTNRLLAGQSVLICGFGDVGKGVSFGFKNAGCFVYVSEIDPLCALQAVMNGFKVVRIEDVLTSVDIILTCTGNKNVILREHMDVMKSGVILCNMGHANLEIDVESLKGEEFTWKRIHSNVDHVHWPNSTKYIILLCEGRLVNLNTAAIPSIVISMNTTAQILALIELNTAPSGRYKSEVYLFPRKLDEQVATLHLSQFHAVLTQLTNEQSKYLGIHKEGPFKTQFYRY